MVPTMPEASTVLGTNDKLEGGMVFPHAAL